MGVPEPGRGKPIHEARHQGGGAKGKQAQVTITI
jgi:hypothetical protein